MVKEGLDLDLYLWLAPFLLGDGFVLRLMDVVDVVIVVCCVFHVLKL